MNNQQCGRSNDAMTPPAGRLRRKLAGLARRAGGRGLTPLAGLAVAAHAAAAGPASAPAERRWEDEVVYVVVTGKFWDGDPTNNVQRDAFLNRRDQLDGGLWGGDLKGATEKLGAIADLGATAIILYPFVQNDEAPVGRFLAGGYRPKDYRAVDRNFGDAADLRRFVDAAHARHLRVLFDMPLCIPGFEHPFLTDPAKRDWFGEPTVYGPRRWKAENPAVGDYLIAVCTDWAARSACDGFRLDSAQLQPAAFWTRFVRDVRRAAGRPLTIVAELPVNPRDIGRTVAACGFDGAYDFSAGEVRDVFGRDAGVAALSFVNAQAQRSYPTPRSMMAQVDNYEEAFVSAAKGPIAGRFRVALAYLLTIDRVPVLYPGDELGIAFRDVGGAFPAGRDRSPQLQELKRLTALRTREPALRRGDFHEAYARDGVYGFVRALGGDRLLVLLNGSDREKSVVPTVDGRGWAGTRVEEPGGGPVVKAAGTAAAVTVPPWEYRVLRLR